LDLPLNLGIAFVPSESGPYVDKPVISEMQKLELLDKIGTEIKKYDYVDHVEVIPTGYLRPGGSFRNLDQLQSMFEIDVIVLIAYDQAQFHSSNEAAITYWTIVGAFIVPGEDLDTHTLMDATVYDIKSRKLLFRAPGIDRISGGSSAVNESKKTREDAQKSFENASKNLLVNLDIQLKRFEERVKESPEEYEIVYTDEYKGSGQVDLIGLFVFIFLAAAGLITRRRP
jgi:rhombotail lipoprotein